MDAIKLFHGEVSEDLLMKEKQFDGLRTKLLKARPTSIGRLEGLLKGQTDRESRRRSERRTLSWASSRPRSATRLRRWRSHRKALAVHRALASEPGADVESKLDVARSLTAAGWLQRSTGDMAGALESFEQARQLGGRGRDRRKHGRSRLGTCWERRTH